jgi:hypothetical protein
LIDINRESSCVNGAIVSMAEESPGYLVLAADDMTIVRPWMRSQTPAS